MSDKRFASRILCGLLLLVMVSLSSACGDGYGENQDLVEVAATPSVAADPSGHETVADDAAFTPDQAERALKDGNGRFVREEYAREDIGRARREELTADQHPFAVIVACSDSRVPPELIFDQGLGDVFVVRVAGNVIDDDALGSVEYAVEHLHAPLVMVMGHEECGAAKAAIEGGPASAGIMSILQKIAPSVDKARAARLSGAGLLNAVIQDNIRASVEELEASPVLQEKLRQGELKIVSGEYMLDTGAITDLET